MAKRPKDEVFESLVWEEFSQHKCFDSMLHTLKTSREIMRESHKVFDKMSVRQQLSMCVTINLMVTDTLRQHMNEHKPLTLPEKKDFKYSLYRNFKERINIKLIE